MKEFFETQRIEYFQKHKASETITSSSKLEYVSSSLKNMINRFKAIVISRLAKLNKLKI